MSTTLDYALRGAMKELTKKSRLSVLMTLVLHSNKLNRCWPTMKTLTYDTGANLTTVTEAKNWLIEHGAIELVPVGKRVGAELKLTKRRHVYQLTGVLTIDDKTVPYLYQQEPPTDDQDSVIDHDSMIIESRRSEFSDPEVFPEENTSKSTDTSKNTLGEFKIYEPQGEQSQKQPSQYGDIFVLVRQYCFNDAQTKSINKRAGQLAKTLLDENPDLTVDQFEDFHRYWIGTGLHFPSKLSTLPTELASWLNRDSYRSARDDTPFKRVPKKEKGQ